MLVIIPEAGQFLIVVLSFIIQFIHRTLHFIQAIPFGHIIVGKPHDVIIFLLFLSIFIALLQWENKGKHWIIKAIVPMMVILIVHFIAPFLNPERKVTILDVGQGDSILIELPYRKAVYLIDSGGLVSFSNDEEWQKRRKTFEIGQDIVVQTLKAKGIRQIDRFLLTHGDYDHIGGAQAVIKELEVEQILYPVGPVHGKEERGLLEEAEKNGVPVVFIGEGVKWSEGNNNFQVLNPVGYESEKNERSIVLYADLSGVKWLFTGDLESEGEERLIAQYPNLFVDVLKVGHHGSDTSTSEEFLEHLSPKIAIISVGRSNRFGHPHQRVIKRLMDKKITILRTDERGAITYRYTKNKQIFTWVIE
ncbi:DNA internalization-related competence protein ComEC/Rec2 [Bacillus taeanensis]|uniref:DNA internalization-related competence protein ComEC/Rec2 n=1 Tax=Bacillus taeanensis TaxID=273032 RepID=UPI00319DA6C1